MYMSKLKHMFQNLTDLVILHGIHLIMSAIAQIGN